MTSSPVARRLGDFPRSRWAAPVSLAGLVLAGVGLLWLRFHASAESAGAAVHHTATFGDLLNYYLPMAEHAARRVTAGELPLWNPHLCSGVPLLASMQIAVFYPGTWLGFWLPAREAIPLLMFAECVLGGWFAALLFRSFGHGVAASALGALLFAFGCLLGQTLWMPVASTILWLPWLLLCIERLVHGFHRGWWCGLVAGVALQLLAGFPQYLVYSFYIAVPFALVRLLGVGRASGLSTRALAARAAPMMLAVVIGVGLAALQLLPTLELALESVRREALPPAEVHYLNNADDAYTAAHVLRAAFDGAPRSISFSQGTSGGYLGIITPVLIAVGIAAGWRRARTWLWLVLGVGALLLADGYLGFSRDLYRLYAGLPVVGSFRTPERLRLVTFFCAIALAVAGFDELGRDADAARRRRLQNVMLVAAAGVASVMIWLQTASVGAWRLVPAVALLWIPLEWPARPWLRRGARLALLAVVVVDLAAATVNEGPLRMIQDHLRDRPGSRPVFGMDMDFLEAARDANGLDRLELVRFFPRLASGRLSGGFRPSCWEPLAPAQWPSLHRALTGEPSRGATLYDLEPEEFATYYDVTSVRWIARPHAESGHEPILNPDALPRAYLVGRYRVVTQDRAFESIRAGDVDFRQLVLLERDPQLGSPGRRWPGIRKAWIASYEPERVVVDVDSPGPALLVLTDSDHPGWRARVDGVETEILRANGLYRAVRVGADSRRVVFEYHPRSLYAGAVVSLVFLALAIGVAWLGGRGARDGDAERDPVRNAG